MGSVDPVTRRVGEKLGVRKPNGGFVADGSVYAQASDCRRRTPRSTGSARSGPGPSGSSPPRFGSTSPRSCVVVAAVVAAVGYFNPFDVNLVGLPFAAFVVGAFGVFGTGVGTRRAKAGREVWSRAGGFKRLLSTSSSGDRFDFSARKDLYTAYIPYAMAFGVARAWAKKYRTATGAEPPTPAWRSTTGLRRVHRAAASPARTASASTASRSSLASSLSAYQSHPVLLLRRRGSSGGGGGGERGRRRRRRAPEQLRHARSRRARCATLAPAEGSTCSSPSSSLLSSWRWSPSSSSASADCVGPTSRHRRRSAGSTCS
ncbi:MAG: hypothetical protein WKF83_12880 [Nocardioidaceae bacterium]